jgi:uncharacterized protein DUF4333
VQLSRSPLLLLAPLAAAGLAACSVSVGGSTEIDHTKAEKFLAKNLRPKPKSITCPSGVKAKTGGTFECTFVLADGKKGTVTVHMRNSKGDVHVTDRDIHLQR